MELLGRNAHFAAEAKLAAIGEPGGTVDIDCSAVHGAGEVGGGSIVCGDDGFAVAGGVGGDVLYGRFHIVHNAYGEDVIQKFGVEILFFCGFAGDDAVMTAPETRSSSPVRIVRDDSRQSAVRGLYPTGEGAGYAGGIMSAAIDGIQTAEAILQSIQG